MSLKNGILSSLRARVVSIPISQWIFSFFQLVCAVVSIIWLFVYPPPSGYAISLMAFAAAIMSVHSDMKRFQKAIWLVLICILLPIEFKAIKRDRQTASTDALKEWNAQENHFSEVREGQEQDFKNITQGFTNTLAQNEQEFRTTQLALNKTLTAAEQTQNQTHPQALLHVDRTFVDVHNAELVFHTYLLNDGNDLALDVSYLTEGYVTNPNLEDEEKIVQIFENDWSSKRHKLREPIPLHEIEVLPNESQSLPAQEVKEIAAGKKALYYVTRIAYTDSTGHWFSDRCSIRIRNQGLPHICTRLDKQRYKVPLNQH